jgi:YD repeat-containing protein
MTAFTYSRIPAFNPNTSPSSVAKSASGSVYDKGDVGFLTPLNLTLLASNTVTTTLFSDANGMFPDFTLLDRTSVVFKSGTISFVLTTSDPIPGPPGAASTVPGPPGPATTDASLLTAGTVAEARLPSNLAATALNATYDRAFEASTSIAYDGSGNVTSTTEGGITTTFTYNADGTVNTETRLGKVRTWAYDGSGNPTSSTVV